MSASPTYAACLTPAGAGAIAVIAVRGPQALSVIQDSLVRRASEGWNHPSLARRTNGGRFYLGKFGADAADEVVLSIRRDDWLELHCHGGVEVVRMCLETLQERGVQTCTWQQLERLTADVPLRAAATAALAEARTARTAAILLDQFRGAFERVVREVLAALDNQEQATAGCILGELTARAALGRHLTTPWRVVIAGAPNVGKSSVVNALAGYQRSIVSPTPGTTRDVVGTSIAIDGWPVELSDTAGLRGQAESLEEQGMRRAHEAIAVADLCVWVLDGSTVPVEPPFASDRWLRVINKVDLPPAWDWEREPDALRVSAQTGAGIADLCAALGRRLVPEPPPSGSAVPFTLELCAGIGKAERALGDGDPAGARQILAELLDAV